jgi:HJR/Mrr/RecB family endonuclease
MRHPAARRVLWINDDIRSDPVSLQEELPGPPSGLGTSSGVVVEHVLDRALQRLRAESFDLIVVDERVAGRWRAGTGITSDGEFAEWLREAISETEHPDIPFIYLTSRRLFTTGPGSLPGFQGVVSRRGDVWRLIAESLDRLIEVPGLVAVDGTPLRPDSSAGHELLVKFKSARDEVLKVLARRPELLRHMGNREFEELIADLFSRDGFEVELTSRSSDGGVDIRAMRQTGLGKLLCLVECKRYKEANRIGPKLVRELRGVVDRDMATCGVLATTSSFTDGAYQEGRASPFRLFLKDVNQIAGWIKGESVF